MYCIIFISIKRAVCRIKGVMFLEIFWFISRHAYYILAFASVIPSFFWLKEFKDDLRIKHIWQILVYLACIYLIGMLGSNATSNLQNLVLGFEWSNRRGWSIFFTVPLFYLILAKLTKRDLKSASDILCVQLMIAYAFGRTACLFQGCCVGTFIPGTSIRWPVVAVEVLFVLAFVFFMGKKAFQRHFDGKSYPVFLISYGAFRLLLEVFRDTDISPVYNIVLYGCVIFIILGAAWLLSLHIFSKKQIIQGGKHVTHASPALLCRKRAVF